MSPISHNTPLLATITVSAAALSAVAGLPSAHTWPMEHIMISMDGSNNLTAHVSTDADHPVLMRRFPGEHYDGAASALDNQYYTDQYGWMLDAFIDPGAGNSIWVQLVTQTDGLETYEGGMRSMIAMHSFDPIFTTGASDTSWQWSGTMTHNWYAAADLGDYSATYSVFIADDRGEPVAAYGATTVTLNLRAVPAPAPVALLGIGALIAMRTRRA